MGDVLDLLGVVLSTVGEIDGSGNSIRALKNVDEGLATADKLASDAHAITAPATPMLAEVAEIPVEPLPDLQPVGEVVSMINKALSDTIIPVLKTVLEVLSPIVLLLSPLLPVLDQRSKKSKTFVHSLQQAASVSKQVEEKYGSAIPPEISKESTTLESSIKSVSSGVDEINNYKTKVKNKLHLLNVFHEIAGYLDPIMKFLKPVQEMLDKVLSKTGGLFRGMERAIAAVNKWGSWAYSHIKSALKADGINLSFVNNLEKEIKRAEDHVLNKLMEPIRRLSHVVDKDLKNLESPLKELHSDLSNLEAKLSELFSSVQKPLNDYISAAAKIGIKPSQI